MTRDDLSDIAAILACMGPDFACDPEIEDSLRYIMKHNLATPCQSGGWQKTPIGLDFVERWSDPDVDD